jgi:tRNA threonylcarbamoyladenosine biosynthesis protein TsaB
MLQALLADVGWSPRNVELVAVAFGPGSFTGLRIGVTTGKAFAYAAGAQVAAVETMDALAAQSGPGPASLWTTLDAQRQELFVAKFSLGEDGPVRQQETRIMPQDAWLAALRAGDHVTGPPLGRLRPRLPTDVVALPEANWQPMAATVGQVAWRAFQQGQRDDVWKLAPKYIRPSAAEEKAARNM